MIVVVDVMISVYVCINAVSLFKTLVNIFGHHTFLPDQLRSFADSDINHDFNSLKMCQNNRRRHSCEGHGRHYRLHQRQLH